MVIVAAELLKVADRLVKEKIHPTSIIGGFRLACKEAVKYIQVGVFGVLWTECLPCSLLTDFSFLLPSLLHLIFPLGPSDYQSR